MQKPKAGDPILFVGKNLSILHLKQKPVEEGGRLLAVVGDADEYASREKAREEIAALRAEQVVETEKAKAAGQRHNTVRWEELRKKIGDISASLPPRGYPGLRVDLLEWWEEKGCWVSPGRILSDKQKEAYKKLTKVKGEFDHRLALASLEATGRA